VPQLTGPDEHDRAGLHHLAPGTAAYSVPDANGAALISASGPRGPRINSPYGAGKRSLEACGSSASRYSKCDIGSACGSDGTSTPVISCSSAAKGAKR